MEQLQYNPEAIWISHSAIDEFYRCPKSYFYRYLYTDKSGSRITVAEPSLTLGILVDEVIKYYFRKKSQVSLDDLNWYLDFKWKLKSGKAGGFATAEQELIFREKAKKFIKTFYDNIKKLNINPEVPEFLQMRLFEEGDVRLCGSPDLYDHLPDGTVHVIDFKTSEREATDISLQLPIYKLLVENNLGKKVSKISYWYLNLQTEPKEVVYEEKDFLADIKFKTQAILKARDDKDFKCLKGPDGCFKCRDYDLIDQGLGEIVGKDKKRIVYFVNKNQNPPKKAESLYSDDLPF